MGRLKAPGAELKWQVLARVVNARHKGVRVGAKQELAGWMWNQVRRGLMGRCSHLREGGGLDWEDNDWCVINDVTKGCR